MNSSERFARLFPAIEAGSDQTALIFDHGRMSYAELRIAVGSLCTSLVGLGRIAVLADARIETCVAVFAAMKAGGSVIPLNPTSGELELRHVLQDCQPEAVLAAAGAEVPSALAERPIIYVESDSTRATRRRAGENVYRPELIGSGEQPALIMYTSGTTGPPKGVMISGDGMASNLDGLAAAWGWTSDDIVVQALPLFHGHGLVFGMLGALRHGATVRHLGRFTPERVLGAFSDGGGTMLFAVPTMFHRIAEACESAPDLAQGLRSARLLVSGSAMLPMREHVRIRSLTGHDIVERYGTTETLIATAVRHDEEPRPGYVGRALDSIDVKLVDESGRDIRAKDDQTIGEVAVRGPSLFLGYLNLPDATEAALREGWFLTGDMATQSADGYFRIVGRKSTDMIKSGGYRIGAGEIESAILEHPLVAEVAVLGRQDEDLGERIVAWVVTATGAELTETELIQHVETMLSKHKRPRVVHFVPQLPRNALGKVQKHLLTDS
jgi:malonyl-CoA/methylmalonyl-CoA synthetase